MYLENKPTDAHPKRIFLILTEVHRSTYWLEQMSTQNMHLPLFRKLIICRALHNFSFYQINYKIFHLNLFCDIQRFQLFRHCYLRSVFILIVYFPSAPEIGEAGIPNTEILTIFYG